MKSINTNSAPGLLLMHFLGGDNIFIYIPNIFRCSSQSSGKPLRSLDNVSEDGSSCPAIAFGDGRMPLRMASMMSESEVDQA